MLSQSYCRLCSKCLMVRGMRNLVHTSKVYFPCSSDQKVPYCTTSSSDLLRESSCRHKGNRILSVIENQYFSIASVPSLYVGAKAVVNMTITRDMMKCFAQATGDWNPIHFDEAEFGAENEDVISEEETSDKRKPSPIVHGAFLNGIVSGVISNQLPGPGTVVVSQVFKFPASLPVGSQIAVEVEVLDVGRKEVNVGYQVVAIPSGSVVMDGTARLMVPKGRTKKGC